MESYLHKLSKHFPINFLVIFTKANAFTRWYGRKKLATFSQCPAFLLFDIYFLCLYFLLLTKPFRALAWFIDIMYEMLPSKFHWKTTHSHNVYYLLTFFFLKKNITAFLCKDTFLPSLTITLTSVVQSCKKYSFITMC